MSEVLTIKLEFNNGVEFIFDNVVNYELNGRFLDVRFVNGYVRSFDIDNIKILEELKK